MKEIRFYSQAVYLNNLELSALPKHSRASECAPQMSTTQFLSSTTKACYRSFVKQTNQKLQLVELKDHPELLDRRTGSEKPRRSGLGVYTVRSKSSAYNPVCKYYQIDQAILDTTVVVTTKSNLSNYSSMANVFSNSSKNTSLLETTPINATSTEFFNAIPFGFLASMFIDQIDQDDFTISLLDDESEEFGAYIDFCNERHDFMVVQMRSETLKITVATPRVFLRNCSAERKVKEKDPDVFKKHISLYGPDFTYSQDKTAVDGNPNHQAANTLVKQDPENRMRINKKQLDMRRSKAARNRNIAHYERNCGSLDG